uniref:Uncharacterized protein n=1 Tax=Rhizophagus irregularis (strain DAOM 181602 / DAOM 197198 / MUCL 43194) TaxID=747089 RepID=U9UKX2_RHIID
MRECVYNAGLLTTLNSANLEFITEPETVVLRCCNVVKDHNLRSGVSEFSYLLSRVRGVFIDQVSITVVPALSTAVAARGAITYGSNVERTFLNGLMGKFFKVACKEKKNGKSITL